MSQNSISNPISFPLDSVSKFFLTGPVGLLEAKTTWPPNSDPNAVMVLCHPHPLHGGTMNNKIITILARAADHLGCASIRFNFRGVGQSQGEYGSYTGECEDLRAVLNWIAQVLPGKPIYLAGFSFGAYISMSLANTPSVAALITIAPAVSYEGYLTSNSVTIPWLIIQGDQDEVVSCDKVIAWHTEFSPTAQLVIIKNATHFFHGHLLELELIVERYLRQIL